MTDEAIDKDVLLLQQIRKAEEESRKEVKEDGDESADSN